MHSTTPTPDSRCAESIDGALSLLLNRDGGLTVDGVRHRTILSAMTAITRMPPGKLPVIGKLIEDDLGGLVRVTCDYDREVWQGILASHGNGHPKRVAA